MRINLDEFKSFDSENFLRGRSKRLEERQKLEERLTALTPLPSINNESGVRGSDISDPTSVMASQEMEILDKIDSIDECEQAYNYALNQLYPEERELILSISEPKMSVWKFRIQWSHENFMGDTMFYKERERVLRKFGELIDLYIDYID